MGGFDANVAAWTAKSKRIKNPLYRPWVRKRNSDGSLCTSLEPLRHEDAVDMTYKSEERSTPVCAHSSVANAMEEPPAPKTPASKMSKCSRHGFSQQAKTLNGCGRAGLESSSKV